LELSTRKLEQRLIYTFGSGCIGGWYRQGSSTGGVTDTSCSRRLTRSLLDAQRLGKQLQRPHRVRDDDDVKERFIEAYGVPAHTQGWGGSALLCAAPDRRQLSRIAGRHHSRLLVPGSRSSHTINVISDSWLLDTYFTARQAAMGWRHEQKRQVTGFLQIRQRAERRDRARRIDPECRSAWRTGDGCASVPAVQRYDPGDQMGVRCTCMTHR